MSVTTPVLSPFAEDVARGLSGVGQKFISARYFYDDLGSALFEAITLLPEYGLTRADERLLRAHAAEIAATAASVATICELGSGSGKKTRYVVEAVRQMNGNVIYSPIDVSSAALETCQKEMGDLADVRTVCADWLDGLAEISSDRSDRPLLLLFLGSSIGNLDRNCIRDFLTHIRCTLRPGDLFLLGVDLVKPVDTMLAAYDDPTGVTAAFNLNVLGRMNRELDADFDLSSFTHEVHWNNNERRIEMHLRSRRDQRVKIGALDTEFHFQAGETIWTESSHKFTKSEVDGYALSSGFTPVNVWTDSEWPFAEVLWGIGSALDR